MQSVVFRTTNEMSVTVESVDYALGFAGQFAVDMQSLPGFPRSRAQSLDFGMRSKQTAASRSCADRNVSLLRDSELSRH